MLQVHNLIVELAVFEKEPEEVDINSKDLETMGFENKTPLFKCFVAEFENKIVGAAIIYNRFSTWKGKTLHLEDLIVTKKMRGKGIGSKLFDKVILYGKNFLKVEGSIFNKICLRNELRNFGYYLTPL